MLHVSLHSSKKAVFDNKKGIRGGIPVVFRKSVVFTNYAKEVYSGTCRCCTKRLPCITHKYSHSSRKRKRLVKSPHTPVLLGSLHS